MMAQQPGMSALKRQRLAETRTVLHEKRVLVVHKSLPCSPDDCQDCGALKEALGASHCQRVRLLNAKRMSGSSLPFLQDDDTVVAVHDETTEQELLDFLRLSDRKQLKDVTLVRLFDWVFRAESSNQLPTDAQYMWPRAQVVVPPLAVVCPQGAGGSAWMDRDDSEDSSKRIKIATGAKHDAGSASGAMERGQFPPGKEAVAVEDENQGAGSDVEVPLEEEDVDANGWRRSYGESDRCVSVRVCTRLPTRTLEIFSWT